jgi:Protein of Unknown function (DUF2784)
MYMEALAALALAIHLAWILWVVFGALWTRRRPVLSTVHILSLTWGIAVEVSPWPCPLTLAEQFFEQRAGEASYGGGFLMHYLDRLVYPDVPESVLVSIGVSVCAVNLGVYIWRYWSARSMRG